MKSKRGLSLIEALVTLGVTGLIMTFMGMTVSYTYQRFRTSTQRNDRQQQVLLCSQRLGIDLRRAPSQSVVAYYPSGSPAAGDLALSMETPMTDSGNYQRDSQGSLLYQAYSIYYRHPGSGEIRWLRVALAAPTPLATPQLATALAAAISLPATRTLVRGPVEFRMLDANGVATDVVTDPTRLQVVMLGVSGPGRLPFTFVVDPPG